MPLGRRGPEEGPSQQRNILDALAERRNVDVKDSEPVKEILTEFAPRHEFIEGAIRGSQHAKIGATSPRISDRGNFVLLDRPQQLHLNGGRYIADFVEKHGPAVGEFKQSLPGLLRPRKCAAHVSEEFAFDQAGAQGRQACGQEWVVFSPAVTMDGLCNQLLAGAAFARDQHGHVGGRDSAICLKTACMAGDVPMNVSASTGRSSDTEAVAAAEERRSARRNTSEI